MLARDIGGYFMDQFTYAERATDWRGNNKIAESIFTQMEHEPSPIPAHLVMSTGTGGTSATLGRYIRHKGYDTEIKVVDPESSVFYDSYVTGDRSLVSDRSSRIEGVGRPKVQHSFQSGVIDHMIQVPDAASIATMLWLEELIGRKTGPSTGTNLWRALAVAQGMVRDNRQGSIVTLL